MHSIVRRRFRVAFSAFVAFAVLTFTLLLTAASGSSDAPVLPEAGPATPGVHSVAHAGGAGAPDPDTRAALRTAAEATAAFTDPEVATEAGYHPFPPEAPLHECIDSDAGAMGIHWVNDDLVGDSELAIDQPEVLVYAPRPNGGLKLVALEYVVFADAWANTHPDAVPVLFDRQLTFHSVAQRNNPYEIPSFWEIHAWAHRPNPDGPFAGFNQTVRCSDRGVQLRSEPADYGR